MIELLNFEPAELGLPQKFKHFRPEQVDAIERILNSDKRFVLTDLPTGSGKTLVGMGAAQGMAARTAFLTSTLGLQEQYLREFAEIGLVDIRGKGNYDCIHDPRETCKFGKYAGCPHLNNEGTPTQHCTYGGHKVEAMRARLVLTNYSYWIRVDGGEKGLNNWDKGEEKVRNPFDLLVLDEAHQAPEELTRSLQLQMTDAALRHIKLDFKKTDDFDFWVKWANDNQPTVKAGLIDATTAYRKKATEASLKMLRYWDMVSEFVGRMVKLRPDNWICQLNHHELYGNTYIFSPIWPGDFSMSRLFFDIPKVVLMSATLRPHIARMLGIPKDEYEFCSWPRIFPPHRTPILHIPTVSMRYQMPEEKLKKWVDQMDTIIGSRPGRKGLIHTKSHDRARYVYEHSKYRHLMIHNSDRDAESATAYEKYLEFKEADAPRVLVSPSFSTGWDFPDEMCRYQIIAKVPLINKDDPLTAARIKRNSMYVEMLAMQELMQAVGRGTRHEDDWCEVFIVDDYIRFFMKQFGSLGAEWFKVRTIACVPIPIEF